MEPQRRVMVVEDDESIREMLSTALSDEEYEVRGASDGRVALDLLRAWKPDVIILDLVMPGLDGEEFGQARRSLEGATQIPLILISATRVADLPEAAERIGADAYFAKPLEIEDLVQTVDRLSTRETPTA